MIWQAPICLAIFGANDQMSTAQNSRGTPLREIMKRVFGHPSNIYWYTKPLFITVQQPWINHCEHSPALARTIGQNHWHPLTMELTIHQGYYAWFSIAPRLIKLSSDPPCLTGTMIKTRVKQASAIKMDINSHQAYRETSNRMGLLVDRWLLIYCSWCYQPGLPQGYQA